MLHHRATSLPPVLPTAIPRFIMKLIDIKQTPATSSVTSATGIFYHSRETTAPQRFHGPPLPPKGNGTGLFIEKANSFSTANTASADKTTQYPSKQTAAPHKSCRSHPEKITGLEFQPRVYPCKINPTCSDSRYAPRCSSPSSPSSSDSSS